MANKNETKTTRKSRRADPVAKALADVIGALRGLTDEDRERVLGATGAFFKKATAPTTFVAE